MVQCAISLPGLALQSTDRILLGFGAAGLPCYTRASLQLQDCPMMELAYDRLRDTPTATDPFTHVVVTDFVPAPDLRRIVAGLPKLGRGGSFPVSGLRLDPAGRALFAEMEGPRFRQAIADKFDLDLDDAPTMITLRGRSRERDGRIHCDSTAKRVTILLYLNPENDAWSKQQGCLRLLRSSTDIEDYAVEVPPVNGTLLVFPNGPTTWHGHKQFIGPRYVVQLNYMTTDERARSELRRHRFSALVKRLTLAA
jgi:SM-20-related protein